MTSIESTEIPSSRKRREESSLEKLLINFDALCSVPTRYDLKDVESSIRMSTEIADSADYDLFDGESFRSLSLKFEKPKIIKYKPPSKEVLAQKISESFL